MSHPRGRGLNPCKCPCLHIDTGWGMKRTSCVARRRANLLWFFQDITELTPVALPVRTDKPLVTNGKRGAHLDVR